ncbi:MAG: 50S ribosomal protein L21 [Gammaproteobacteria bacterium AqS3]|nr:50S ribosomal protein L21 [Gammaproteobacteria bacterium AqS3]
MYAVFKTGGQQHRVSVDDVIQIERLKADTGEEISFAEVLLISDGEGDVRIGTPVLEGSQVVAQVLEHGRGPKLDVVKVKRRKGYRRRIGHRQGYTRIKITQIS